MPALSRSEAAELIRRRAAEWTENQKRWRFLADSYEGGNRYRHADYAIDPTVPWSPAVGASAVVGQAGTSPLGSYDSTTGQASPFGYLQIVDRNLVPHLSETGDNGKDTYLLRLARTPVPKTLERTIRRHLSRIYAREVKRSGPPALARWWDDVDGCETPIDKWMRKVVGPMICTYGCLDLVFDRPRADDDRPVETRADQIDAGLDRCVGGYILPENMLWWKKDRQNRHYLECLVLERDEWGQPQYRHWTGEDSVLYTGIGSDPGKPIEVIPHPYGRPPIVRLFDERKLRAKNVGQPRYESIAELQKAIYNGWSELILNDIFQSSPLLQGPEKYLLEGESKVEVGPDHILPSSVDANGNLIGWSYVDPPKGASADQLQHIREFGELADRDAALMKPAGTTTGSTVSQSGVSKAFDSQEGNDYLAEVSETLGDAEMVIAEYAQMVLADGLRPSDTDAVTVDYPKEFDLFTADDLSTAIADIQALAASAGQLPQVEGELFDRLLRALLPGLDDPTMARLRSEVDAMIAGKAADREMARESGVLGATAESDGAIDEPPNENEGYDNSQANFQMAMQATS